MKTHIKELRARHLITQEELAEYSGVRRETITRIENGIANPSVRVAHRIAEALFCGIDDLFTFADESAKLKPIRRPKKSSKKAASKAKPKRGKR